MVYCVCSEGTSSTVLNALSMRHVVRLSSGLFYSPYNDDESYYIPDNRDVMLINASNSATLSRFVSDTKKRPQAN